VGNLLATAVDSSTWTTAIIDQSLRLALDELNGLLVYEDDFTVTVAGYSQDLSGMTAINSVLSVAYPWVEGSDPYGTSYGRSMVAWRFMGHNVIYLSQAQPQVGEVLRVRFTKLHVIEDLDSALATTVPEAQRSLVGLWAAAFACDLRIRQVSENPALPKEAAQVLARSASNFRGRATEMVSRVPPLGRLRWGEVGL
jgi:hypothetical protein